MRKVAELSRSISLTIQCSRQKLAQIASAPAQGLKTINQFIAWESLFSRASLAPLRSKSVLDACVCAIVGVAAKSRLPVCMRGGNASFRTRAHSHNALSFRFVTVDFSTWQLFRHG